MRSFQHGLLVLLSGLAPGWAAQATDIPPPFSIAVRETLDLWDNAAGGLTTGGAALNKLQISATLQGDVIHLPGFAFHAQVFRLDGDSLSSKLGDIQTASNIEGGRITRLFEAWVERRWGDEQSSVAARAGLIDLNADFDSIDPASLFINSSQGIGPDLSRSGRNGPSIFPVSSAGVRLTWAPNKAWTFKAAAFDGVSGDPNQPTAFVRVRLAASDGALLIGQADYHISDKSQFEVGTWRYTQAVTGFTGQRGNGQGIYASLTGAAPGAPEWTGWVRAGLADAEVQTVGGYLGAGVVRKGVIASRPEDRLGFAIARAFIGNPARSALGISRAETSFEGSYQVKVNETFALQPDAQYIDHPAGRAGARSAMVLGMRVVLTGGYPTKAPAAEPTDPTVAPDGPPPLAP
jgi:porin